MSMRLLSAAAALALMSGAAMAQSTAPSPTAPMSPAPVNPDPTAAAPADQTVPPDPSAASSMPADPSAATTLPAPAPTGTAADTAATVPASSMPAEQQAGLKAGDPGVTANPPIADTPQNRQLYGKPLSNAGRRSAPNGN